MENLDLINKKTPTEKKDKALEIISTLQDFTAGESELVLAMAKDLLKDYSIVKRLHTSSL